MNVEWLDPFDYYFEENDSGIWDEVWSTDTSGTITWGNSGDYSRTGKSVKVTVNEDNKFKALRKSITNRTTYYLGFAIYVPYTIEGEGNRMIFLVLGAGSTPQVGFGVENGILKLWRGPDTGTGGTELVSTGESFVVEQWNYYGIKITIDDSSGAFECYQNGVQIANSTSLDTRNTSDADITTVSLGACTEGLSSKTIVMYFDDFLILTDEIPNQRALYTLTPSASGYYSEWTASSTPAYAQVNEATPDFDDYIAAQESGYQHTFDFSHSIPNTLATVDTIAMITSAKVIAAGVNAYRHTLRLNGTNAYGTSHHPLTDENYYVSQINRPGAGTWSPDDLETLEIGVYRM